MGRVSGVQRVEARRFPSEPADGFLVIVVILAFNDNLKHRDKVNRCGKKTTSKEVEHLLSTENELISTFSWEIFLREHMSAALQQIVSLFLALVRNAILIPPLSMRSTPINDQRTRTLFYKTKGKYMREYRTNIGLTPICLIFSLIPIFFSSDP